MGYKRRLLLGWLREQAKMRPYAPGDRAISTKLDVSMNDAVDLVDALESEGLIKVSGIGALRVIEVLAPPGVTTAAEFAAHKNTSGASGTAREASSVSSSGDTNRIPDRAPIRKPAPAAVRSAPPAAAAVPAEAETRRDGGVDQPQRVEAPHPTFGRGQKPFIRADVIRAARDRGEPLDQFVTALIDIGFSAWKGQQA